MVFRIRPGAGGAAKITVEDTGRLTARLRDNKIEWNAKFGSANACAARGL